MSKWNMLHVFINLPLGIIAVYSLGLLALVNLIGYYGEYNYPHLEEDEIESKLYKEVNPELLIKRSKPNCNYEEVLKSPITINNWEVPKFFDDFSAGGITNGSFIPSHCNPAYSVAIIATYRNRQSQLDVWLPYIHNFLRQQNIHYKIYLVEQQDEKPWNKGLLYNIGAKKAISDKFPCLILHDIDLLPLDNSNIYACTQQPRHLSASIDKFRFVLPYRKLVGGVLAITADQYRLLNGFSNQFQGWGGEDDDMAERIAWRGLQIYRFPREMSRYTMMVHAQEPRNAQRAAVLRRTTARLRGDGLDSLAYERVLVSPQRLLTLIAVAT